MKPLRIALTKGRLEKDTVALFDRMGLDTSAVKDKGRRLILPVGEGVEVVLAKAADVITYVEHGVCDLGVVGKDTIAESGGSFYEILDLGFGRCRFALAAPKDSDFFAGYAAKTVASKYPNAVSYTHLIAGQVEERLRAVHKPITVAVMGCVVNGPGEAREADVGLAGGKGKAGLFKKGEIIRTVSEEDAVEELMKEIERL